MSMHLAVPFAYLLAVVLVLVATVLAIRYARGHSRSARLSRPVRALWCGILALTGVLSWHFHQADPRPQPVDRPIEISEDGFVSSRNCRSCHLRQYETWHASYHRTMTQLATPETVIGEFDGRFLERDGYEFGVQRDGDRFMVTLLDDLGRPTTRPVVMTTGFHHMQVYWFSTGNSRMLGHFPFVYLREEKRWISSDASFLHPDQQNMTHAQLTNAALWNHTCLKCHVTNPRALIQYSTASQRLSMDTHVAEFGIACEACHGPGEDHVAANQNPLHRYSQRFHNEPDSTITNPGRLDHRRASQVCGICHSITNMGGGEGEIRWRERGNTFRPGDEITDHRKIVSFTSDPEMLEEMTSLNPHYLADRFWDDGMVRVSGREFNGLLETRCYTHGEMSCLSCHTLHPPEDDPRPLSEWADDQLKIGMRGNQACLQCHEELDNEQQLTAHTHHPAASSGSLCYNCHMPYTTYGLQKAIRSHQVDSPSVQASLETGRPNACNLCHLDKTMAWAADGLDQWYGIARPELEQDQQQVAASVLWLLKGDAGQRALIAWAMGWQPAREISGDNWMVPYLGQLLLDPYGAVRFIAARSLRRLEGYKEIDYDFELPAEKREAAVERIRQQWSREPGAMGDRGSVLVDESGQLDWDVFRRLLGTRNDRRINLAE